jgi:hypothetical protein
MALNIPSGGSSILSSIYADVSSTSDSFDAKTDARRTLVVNLHMDDLDGANPTFDAVTFNSVGLTQRSAGVETYAAGARTVRHEVWSLHDPASGSNTLAVTISGAADAVGVIAQVHADSGGFVAGKAANSNGNVLSYSLPVTTSASTSWLHGGVGGAAQRDWTMTTGTEVESIGTGGGGADHDAISGYESATGGSDTWDASASTATRSAAACAEFSEDTGGGGANITPPVGDLALSASAPSRLAASLRAVPVAAVLLSAAAPTAALDHARAVPQADLAFSTAAPTLEAGAVVNVPAADLTLSPVAPIRLTASARAVPQADLTFTSVAPDVIAAAGIAYDAYSESSDQLGNHSWSHTLASGANGLLVAVVQTGGTTDVLSGATAVQVGSTNLTRIRFDTDAAGPGMGVYWFFLGSSVPTGLQTISTNKSGGLEQTRCSAWSVTADTDTEVDTSNATTGDQDDPSITLSTSSGVTTFVATAFASGLASTGDVTEGADYTRHMADAAFSLTRHTARRTNLATGGNVTVDWTTASSDDVAMSAIAIREAISGAITPPVADLTLSATAPTRTASSQRAVPVADLALSSSAPTISAATEISPPVGTLTLSTTAPARLAASLRAVPVVDLTLSATAPTISAATEISPPAADLSLSATAPTVTAATEISPPGADLALSATAPTVTAAGEISPPGADLALSATAPTRAAASLRVLPQANVTLSTSAPTVEEAGPGAIEATPPAADLTLSPTAPTRLAASARTIPQGGLTLSTTATARLLGHARAVPGADLAFSPACRESDTLGDGPVSPCWGARAARGGYVDGAL